MTQKTTNQNILFLNKQIPFNLHCRFNVCGTKLLILINNYTTLVRQTRDLSVDGSSQKIRWDMYLHAWETVNLYAVGVL